MILLDYKDRRPILLIDDARTPLIISGPVPKGDDQLFEQLRPQVERLVEAHLFAEGLEPVINEVPVFRDFAACVFVEHDRLKPFCEKELGIKFTILHAEIGRAHV